MMPIINYQKGVGPTKKSKNKLKLAIKGLRDVPKSLFPITFKGRKTMKGAPPLIP
jgi:hypothetical protein